MLEGIRIGVLLGGPSSEREVSLKSGKAVLEALKSKNLEAVAIDIRGQDKNYVKDLLLSYDINLAFLALHGAFGEDGKMQAILEEMGIPYTGSGVSSSELAMDKTASRKIFISGGLNAPKHCLLDKNHKNIRDFATFPLVIKPASGGSSIGLSIVDKPQALREAIETAFKYDRRVIAEEYIEGREMTVGIFEDAPLEAIEIKPKRRFFDYKAKYEPGETEYIVPAPVSLEIMRLLKETALKAHNLLGCSFFSRVDIILDKTNKPFVLEVNTIPGFTATSLLPKAASARGIAFPELVVKISEAALSAGQRAVVGLPIAQATSRSRVGLLIG
ncbi:MAG: hypothetical protein A2321_03650 [Omnitrophica WOR_2 bacterium RIFOXYB2_FULL_45_11]|nr:MAG: hypothetical protein A2321_03650 [Omnitrophica WOR_2 bacterium RIFOXYB2_FULL_45_11]OGX61409.1 MAG: hypothetical protein A2471_00665 [Omnitrophica WOR_2 bacterium RIFOXYC2_FULL_45_15]HBU07680.1 D-alanine--D-alanine ligase [Candidatus Omnitrophota bacterium]